MTSQNTLSDVTVENTSQRAVFMCFIILVMLKTNLTSYFTLTQALMSSLLGKKKDPAGRFKEKNMQLLYSMTIQHDSVSSYRSHQIYWQDNTQ